ADGFKLSLSHYGSDADMKIQLEAPMVLEAITWPTSSAGKILPVPKSSVGKFSYEHDDSFFVYIGNTTKADYADYVNACSEKGFNVDYDKGEDYYHADNSEGWHISVRYVGNNIMSIDIDSPHEESETTSTEEAKPDTTEKADTDSNALDPDFKAAMDSYESFMNEYVEFMKKYMANPSDLGLITDYTDYMSRYSDFVEDFEKWKDRDMNAAETAYYVDVQARVSKKLLEITN
ncbi:MAG: hypothetical protein IJC18_01045, partial [Clostridia bacterium]|nr:hypothetical protein [Clostridia bacterium]